MVVVVVVVVEVVTVEVVVDVIVLWIENPVSTKQNDSRATRSPTL